jgi:peptide subunit release factor RF-3
VNVPNPPRWLIAGHPSSQPGDFVDELQLGIAGVLVETNSQFADVDLNSCDAFILVINAKTGVSSAMIELWSRVAERQIPRMIIVNGLEFSETDFDDIVLIANRVLENVVTPFLVLHDELGEPSGLISLSNGMVHDYSGAHEATYLADGELMSLVKDFREELELAVSEMDDSAYAQGILVPALPYISTKKIGLCEIKNFAQLLTTR